MVSERIAASAEFGRLKRLQGILKDFVQQINELLGPFVPDEEEQEIEEDEFEETPQPPQRAPDNVRPASRFQPFQPQGMRGLSKVPSKTVQRRPMMRPRAEPELSPISRPTPQPRRTPESTLPKVVVTPPTKPHVQAPQPRAFDKNLLSPIPHFQPQPRRTPEQVPTTTTNQAQPQTVKTPATKGHTKPPSPLAVNRDRLSPQFDPNRTAPVSSSSRRRPASPFNRSYDMSPKYLKEGLNKSLKYKPTRVDMVKKIPALDLVQKLVNLEEQVKRATSPTYRPMSPGSPGIDNTPFNRTYTRVADTSFQSAAKLEAAAQNESTESEAEELTESDVDDSLDSEPDDSLVKMYLKKIDEKWQDIEDYFCKSKLTSFSFNDCQLTFDFAF